MSGLPGIRPQKASNDDAPQNSPGLAFNPMDILDTFASPLMVVAGDGGILYANVAAEHLFSTSNKVLQRMDLDTLISPRDVKSALADGSWNSGNRINESAVDAENHKGEALYRQSSSWPLAWFSSIFGQKYLWHKPFVLRIAKDRATR